MLLCTERGGAPTQTPPLRAHAHSQSMSLLRLALRTIRHKRRSPISKKNPQRDGSIKGTERAGGSHSLAVMFEIKQEVHGSPKNYEGKIRPKGVGFIQFGNRRNERGSQHCSSHKNTSESHEVGSGEAFREVSEPQPCSFLVSKRINGSISEKKTPM